MISLNSLRPFLPLLLLLTTTTTTTYAATFRATAYNDTSCTTKALESRTFTTPGYDGPPVTCAKFANPNHYHGFTIENTGACGPTFQGVCGFYTDAACQTPTADADGTYDGNCYGFKTTEVLSVGCRCFHNPF